MAAYKYPSQYKHEALYKTFSAMPKEIIDRARQLFMLYIPPKKILEILKAEHPDVTNRVGEKAFKAYVQRKQWKLMRERLEKRVVENVRYKGYETAVAITVQTAELLKRGLMHLNDEGTVLNVREMERVSTIYERFDKIMRLEQSLPTEIIQGQLTKDKVALLLKDIDYLDGLDDIALISANQAELLGQDEDTQMTEIIERQRLGNTDEELEGVLEESIED